MKRTSEELKKYRISLRENQNLNGVSERVYNVIITHYYKSEDIIKDLKEDIKSGKLSPNSIRGYAEGSHKELCSYLKIEIKPNTNTIEKYKNFLEKNGYTVIKQSNKET